MHPSVSNGVHGGYGYGYGTFGTSLGLTQGTDFKCVDKSSTALPICFGIGAENHALLQQLQQTLNQLAGRAGFKQLDVDGFIGPLTVAAVQAISQLAGDLASFSTKEDIAANAQDIISTLGQLTANASFQLSPTGSPVQPTAQTAAAAGVPARAVAEITTVTSVPQANAASAVAALPDTAKKSLLPWILGGVAAVLIVGGVGFVYYRRKAKVAAGWGNDDGEYSEADGDGDFSDADDGESDEPA